MAFIDFWDPEIEERREELEKIRILKGLIRSIPSDIIQHVILPFYHIVIDAKFLEKYFYSRKSPELSIFYGKLVDRPITLFFKHHFTLGDNLHGFFDHPRRQNMTYKKFLPNGTKEVFFLKEKVIVEGKRGVNERPVKVGRLPINLKTYQYLNRNISSLNTLESLKMEFAQTSDKYITYFERTFTRVTNNKNELLYYEIYTSLYANWSSEMIRLSEINITTVQNWTGVLKEIDIVVNIPIANQSDKKRALIKERNFTNFSILKFFTSLTKLTILTTVEIIDLVHLNYLMRCVLITRGDNLYYKVIEDGTGDFVNILIFLFSKSKKDGFEKVTTFFENDQILLRKIPLHADNFGMINEQLRQVVFQNDQINVIWPQQ